MGIKNFQDAQQARDENRRVYLEKKFKYDEKASAWMMEQGLDALTKKQIELMGSFAEQEANIKYLVVEQQRCVEVRADFDKQLMALTKACVVQTTDDDTELTDVCAEFDKQKQALAKAAAVPVNEDDMKRDANVTDKEEDDTAIVPDAGAQD